MINKYLDATPQELARCSVQKELQHTCLICGEVFEDGVVYHCGGKMFEARRAISEHIRAAHGPVFPTLLRALREQAGLTEHQAKVLGLMAEGRNDKEIAVMASASDNTSSIRNLRFQLREREKQAKAFLALMEAFRTARPGKDKADAGAAASHVGAALADERFAATEQERAAVLKTYLTPEGALKEFPVREKRKIIVLRELASRFTKGRSYSEKEVNETIGYSDFATVRRYMIEYGFLERAQDCSRYWLKGENDGSD